ncbi:MAG: archease, partial [Acidobacteria bacterium]|nr:archease [Acidobacteriota bacterium]
VDPRRHELLTDVKAVTLQGYRVTPTSGGWEAEVVLDV